MQTREGKLEAGRRQKTIDWSEIFNHPELIFTLDDNEYSNVGSVRSAGESYKMRNNLQGVLHVLENMEDTSKVDVQFEPMAGQTTGGTGEPQTA